MSGRPSTVSVTDFLQNWLLVVSGDSRGHHSSEERPNVPKKCVINAALKLYDAGATVVLATPWPFDCPFTTAHVPSQVRPFDTGRAGPVGPGPVPERRARSRSGTRLSHPGRVPGVSGVVGPCLGNLAKDPSTHVLSGELCLQPYLST